MNKERCENCVYVGYLKGLLGGKTYYCRRYPPHAVQAIDLNGKPKWDGLKYSHPQVDANGWCGEYRAE